MSEPIIRVENLGKKYLIKHQQGGERYRALRDVLAGGVRTGFGLFNRNGKGETSTEEFWALKDVSFEVKEGEVVGIIGRNGAGKSTLLKILSRITEPSTGRVTLNGRVASLLEVGTGFHPELTGRENIYLNGSILGMTRREIARKFDEIVAFAEVEKFLDTPVKRYSSGMYVRLAFAVAAHLEPEILVVDEVLAVGDAAFQKKCLGKMNDVAKGGRTVLFVSHDMSAIQSLCPRTILLSNGSLYKSGPTPIILAEYLSLNEASRRQSSYPIQLSPQLDLTAIQILPGILQTGGHATVTVGLRSIEDVFVDHLCVLIYSQSGIRVAIVDLRSEDGPYSLQASHQLLIEADVPCVTLVEGEYAIGLFWAAGVYSGHIYDLLTFEISASTGLSRGIPYQKAYRGYVELNPGPARTKRT